MKNDQKGITLIALIITIIVMLILVAVTLTIALGENGILQKARGASASKMLEQERETLLNLVMGSYDNNNQVQYDVLKASLPEGWSQDGTDITKHTSPTNNIFIVSSDGAITVVENDSGNNDNKDEEEKTPGVTFSGYYKDFYPNSNNLPKEDTFVPEEKTLSWDDLVKGVDKDIYKYDGIYDTYIGSYAFDNCTSLTGVTIPDSVAHIGISAFYNCKSLTSVAIPDGVTCIESNTFLYCDSLTSVTIPDSVTVIWDNAFAFCHSLTSVAIPKDVTHIYYSAFGSCDSLTSVTIPDSVKYIDEESFADCSNLSSVTYKGKSYTDEESFFNSFSGEYGYDVFLNTPMYVTGFNGAPDTWYCDCCDAEYYEGEDCDCEYCDCCGECIHSGNCECSWENCDTCSAYYCSTHSCCDCEE